MAELIQSGAVFLHVPKCGGTWVREALRRVKLWRARLGFKHSSAAHINDIMKHHGWQFIRHLPFHPTVTPGSLRRAYKFCFVRNPVRWYESYWKFMAGAWEPHEPGRWHPQRAIDSCGDDGFNTFVSNVLRERPGYVSEMYSWYTDGCRSIGKCERIVDDLVAVLRELNLTFDEPALRAFPRTNESLARCGQPVWNLDVLDRVIEAEAAGIDRYEYRADTEAIRSTLHGRRTDHRAVAAGVGGKH